MQEATQNTKGAFAIVSVMLLAAAISGASLIRAEASPQASEPHSFVEQGREHDELVKRKGHWYFKHRVITSDGGLQPMFEKLYKAR